MRFKSTLIEFFKRAITYDKKLEIFSNGENNDYPERIERLINNAVTGKTSAIMMASYLAGKGFGEHNKFEVNPKNTLLQFTHKSAKSIARQRGMFIHFNYDLNHKFTSADILPFAHCRIGKKDDDQYNGKIAVCKDWSDVKLAKNAKLIDVYNRNPKVINAQFAAQGEDYKGQVLFVNLDDDTDYPYSTIDAVQNDCDSEYQASIYKNRSLRKGFFGKTLVVTRPLVDANKESEAELWKVQDGEREKFKKTLKGFIGAENADGIMHIEMEFDDEEGLDKAILFKNIDAKIDDKLFSFTESSVSNNIRFAFNNIPAMLVRNTDGQMFGQSGDGITQAKLFYQEQTTMERMILVETIEMIMANFAGFEGTLTHELLIVKKEENNNNN